MQCLRGSPTFNMCTFWLVEALTRAGRLEEARFIFEKMLTYANHLGLYAEETGPSGEAATVRAASSGVIVRSGQLMRRSTGWRKRSFSTRHAS